MVHAKGVGSVLITKAKSHTDEALDETIRLGNTNVDISSGNKEADAIADKGF